MIVDQFNNNPKQVISPPRKRMKKKVVHNVQILDRSISMEGSKWEAAVEGVKEEYMICYKHRKKNMFSINRLL